MSWKEITFTGGSALSGQKLFGCEGLALIGRAQFTPIDITN